MNAPTKTKIRQMVAAANGVNEKSVTIEWVQRCKSVTYPTGHKGLCGKVKVSAPSFRTVELPVSADSYGIWVGR
jgi:hypothetical protein